MNNNRMRVLLLVAESWRKESAGGNTIDNFFNGMKDIEFAQIFCSDLTPKNNVCHRYFVLQQKDVIRNFLNQKKVGYELDNEEINRRLTLENCSNSTKTTNIVKSFLKYIKRIRPEFLISIRMFIWRYCNWKTDELVKFVVDFNPDVIFAPCYPFPFQLALTRYVKQHAKCNIITWVADDCYSLRHLSIDPFFWINRFWNRHCLRKTFSYYDEFFSISEEEAKELEPIVGKKISILRKGVVVPETFIPRAVHKPIRFIYAGGLYLNRHKSLIKIAEALSKLNQREVLAELHIYSGSELDKKSSGILNDGRSSYMHGLISSDELSKIYQESDVAIHCESFDLKYRLMTRLSFSTKIIDCFQSGCAILAIAWEQHTGIRCLKREDAAICVTDVKDIENSVINIVKHPEIIKEYAQKAYECEKRNHRIEDVQQKLYDAFVRNSKSQSFSY